MRSIRMTISRRHRRQLRDVERGGERDCGEMDFEMKALFEEWMAPDASRRWQRRSIRSLKDQLIDLPVLGLSNVKPILHMLFPRDILATNTRGLGPWPWKTFLLTWLKDL